MLTSRGMMISGCPTLHGRDEGIMSVLG